VDFQILPVNDPPAPTASAGISLYRLQSVVLKSSHVRATDVDNADSEIFLALLSLPKSGVLKFNGVDLGVGEMFSQEDINTGKVTYENTVSGVTQEDLEFSIRDSEALSSEKLVLSASIALDLTKEWIVQVAKNLTRYHTCARTNKGRLKCWGQNNYGQLGYNDTKQRGDGADEMGDKLPFVNLGMGLTVKQVDVGGYHSCAILNDDTVKCWGYAYQGQLGYGNRSAQGNGSDEVGDKLLAVDLGTGETARQIALGERHSCALLNSGQVKCWGQNNLGQLGQGNTTKRGDTADEMGDKLLPIKLGTGVSIKAIAAGQNSTCAILNDDTVKCWGHGAYGQLGQGSNQTLGTSDLHMGDNLLRLDLGLGLKVRAISGGRIHFCALLTDDSVKCWGYGANGQLGQQSTASVGIGADQMGDLLPAINLGPNRLVLDIFSGGDTNCAIFSDRSMKCWGAGNFGQLGQGHNRTLGDGPNEMGQALLVVDLGTDQKVQSLSVGEYSVCVIMNFNSVKCFGYEGSGNLGYEDGRRRGDGPNEMGDFLPEVDVLGPLAY